MTFLYDVTLPSKTLWTQSGLAKYMGVDRKTIRIYVERVAPSVLDFRKDLYKKADGTPAYGLPLTDYQAWIIYQLIAKGREMRAAVNGIPIHATVRSWACDNANALSKAAWQACNEVNAA